MPKCRTVDVVVDADVVVGIFVRIVVRTCPGNRPRDKPVNMPTWNRNPGGIVAQWMINDSSTDIETKISKSKRSMPRLEGQNRSNNANKSNRQPYDGIFGTSRLFFNICCLSPI